MILVLLCNKEKIYVPQVCHKVKKTRGWSLWDLLLIPALPPAPLPSAHISYSLAFARHKHKHTLTPIYLPTNTHTNIKKRGLEEGENERERQRCKSTAMVVYGEGEDVVGGSLFRLDRWMKTNQCHPSSCTCHHG